MKQVSVILALLISLSVCNFSQHTAPIAVEGQQQIRNAVEKFSKAFVEADVFILDSLLSEDYLHTNSNGSILNKQQWLKYIETRKKELETGRLEVESYENKGLKIIDYKKTAIVTGTNVAKGKRDGKRFVTELRFTQVWVRQNSQWKRAAFHDSAAAK
jgi:ketosteroid isomerase-like protein